jgi:hypothetical protein
LHQGDGKAVMWRREMSFVTSTDRLGLVDADRD